MARGSMSLSHNEVFDAIFEYVRNHYDVGKEALEVKIILNNERLDHVKVDYELPKKISKSTNELWNEV